MKHKYLEELTIPEGIHCSLERTMFTCKKGSATIHRKVIIPQTTIKIADNKITFTAKGGNKRTFATIKSWIAHIKNMFNGMDNEYVYKMEVCNVHFPMTLKIEGNQLVVSNFLGEKEKRVANILPGVTVTVNGVHLDVKSVDIEAAGQTAANIEKATLVKKRDRRVFQDGIFITSKPGVDL